MAAFRCRGRSGRMSRTRQTVNVRENTIIVLHRARLKYTSKKN